MKKYWIIAMLIVGCAAAASAVLWTRQAALSPREYLTRELNLTADQQTRLAAIHMDFSGKCDSFCADMCEARVELARALDQASSVTPQIEQLLARLQAAQAASERETLSQLFRIKSILTPEQQRKYIELITGKLCGHCPRQLHQR